MDCLKSSRFPSIRDIEANLLKKLVVGTYKSLWYIHCVRDMSVRHIEDQLYFQSFKEVSEIANFSGKCHNAKLPYILIFQSIMNMVIVDSFKK